MFGPKEIKSIWESIAGFGFVFEVIDDPLDTSQFREQCKSVSISLFALTERNDSKIMAMSHEDLRKRKSIYVGSITKLTPIELRKWAASTFETGWVYVFVAPTIEWEDFYEHRVYPAVPISAGYRGNFTVSLPPRRHHQSNGP